MPCNHRRQRLVAVFAASFLVAEPYVGMAQDTRLNELLQSRSQIPFVPADLGRLNLTAVEHLLSSPRTTETAAAITAMADTLFNVHANRLPSESLVVSHFDEVYERALRYQPAEQRELAIGALKSGLTLLGKAQSGTLGVADVPAALDFGTGAYRLHQQLFAPNSAGPTTLIPRDVVTLKLLVLLHPDQAAPLLQRWLGGNNLRLDILEYSALVDSFPPSQRVLAEMLREASVPRSSRAAMESRLAEAQASIGELANGLADVRNSLGRLVEEAKTERSRKELSARVYGALAEGEPATFRNARANLDEAASAVEVHLRPDAAGLMHPAFVGS